MSDFGPDCNFIGGLSIPRKLCKNRIQNIDDFGNKPTKKKIPNCNGLIYHSGPEIETSEMDCQAPARFFFSSFFHFFFFFTVPG